MLTSHLVSKALNCDVLQEKLVFLLSQGVQQI
jgi:hypothetical protein